MLAPWQLGRPGPRGKTCEIMQKPLKIGNNTQLLPESRHRRSIQKMYMHPDSTPMPFLMAPITSSNSIDKWVILGKKVDFS